MDDFDRWWQWAEKPLDSPLTIPAELHHAVTRLPPQDRRDRIKVNEAVRETAEQIMVSLDELKRRSDLSPDEAVRTVVREDQAAA
jgi:hypothetical protein